MERIEVTRFEAIIAYKSGRIETIAGKLNKDKSIPKKNLERINALRKFPTVTDIKIRKF